MRVNNLKLKNEKIINDYFLVSHFAKKVLASMDVNEKQLLSLLDTKTLDDIELTCLQPIVSRLTQAKKNKEKIIVCGDYDCDGVCATTIMYDALIRFGIEAGYYIPNRFKEGYGLHTNTVRMAHEKGYSIIVTVDNGVKALEALQLAKELGIEVILSDHHHYNEEELICDYFLHPSILDSYFEAMCGAGMAFLLSKALLGSVEEHVILAAVATIGDIVPLFKMNRLLVKEGIKLLNQNKYLALQKLQKDSNAWDAMKIAFQIVPKINCVGRLADQANVNTLVKFLCSNNPIEIEQFAKQLDILNEKRKGIMEEMERLAIPLLNDDDFLVVASEFFHEGLNGVLASKLSTNLQKPVMVLSYKNQIYKGSIRSNTVDLTSFFDDIKESLISYGGHKQAAGIGFKEESLSIVKNHVLQSMLQEKVEYEIDCLPLQVEEITLENLHSLQSLEPFGCGFELPLFAIKDHIISIQTLSRDKHIKYNSDRLSYLYFNQGHRKKIDRKDKDYTFFGKLQINQFRNQESVNMIVDYLLE